MLSALLTGVNRIRLLALLVATLLAVLTTGALTTVALLVILDPRKDAMEGGAGLTNC